MASPYVSYVPLLKTTLSHASPEKAAEIRSAVTGALKRDQNVGLCCFEHSVETSFVLPWDLNPRVQPQKITPAVRDGIHSALMDDAALRQLEECGGINWNSAVLWQGREMVVSSPVTASPVTPGQGEWNILDDPIASKLEEGYHSTEHQCTFTANFATFQVDFITRRLFNVTSSTLVDIRRVAFAPLMPLKVRVAIHVRHGSVSPCLISHISLSIVWRQLRLKCEIRWKCNEPSLPFSFISL